jgi:hypothetical protein
MPVPGTHIEPVAPKQVKARVINNPSGQGADLYVFIESFGRQRSHVKGWVPKTPLPKVGDQCLVSYDENGEPWVSAWATSGEGVVTSGTVLPATPFDGQVFDLIVDAAKGIVWRLRYRTASASTYKWEFIGGAPLQTARAGALRKKKTLAEAALTGGPTCIVPHSGEYLATLSLLMGNEGTANVNEINAGLSISGSAIAFCAIRMVYSAFWSIGRSEIRELGALTAAQVLSVNVLGPSNGNSEAAYEQASIALLPVRLV